MNDLSLGALWLFVVLVRLVLLVCVAGLVFWSLLSIAGVVL